MRKINKLYLLIVILCAVLLALIFDNYSMNKRIEEERELIAHIRENDEIQSNKVDTIIKYFESTFSLGEQSLSAKELVLYTNALQDENRLLEDSLVYYKSYFKLYESLFDRVADFNGKQYNDKDFVEPYTKNIKIIEDLLNTNTSYKRIMSLYGIEVADIKIKRDSLFISKISRLDSALMIFPYYKNCLKYNEEKKNWYVIQTRGINNQ